MMTPSNLRSSNKTGDDIQEGGGKGHGSGGNTKNNKDLHGALFLLPKVELHAHLNGCIRDNTLFELAHERNVTLSAHHFATANGGKCSNGVGASRKNPDEDNFMYNVKPRSLQDCFDMFAELPKVINDLKALKRITHEALLDFASHNTIYLELRSTPKCLLHDWKSDSQRKASKRDYIDTILAVMADFMSQKSNKMVCRLIIAVDRSLSFEEGKENIELAIDFASKKNPLVAGVDLGGNPTKNSFSMFQPLFECIRNEGKKKLGITIHCGEIPCDKESPGQEDAWMEAKSILEFGPDRLGHALLLPTDLQSLLAQKQIPVETCPTSNVMTLELARHVHGHLIEGLKQHPSLLEWITRGHPISVGTDDPGVFDTNQTKELFLLHGAFSETLSLQDIANIVSRSMEYAFCDDETKSKIQGQIRRGNMKKM